MNAGESGGFRLTYVLDGTETTVNYRQPEVTIGRSSECDLALRLPGMSRQHAFIQRVGDGWMIFDKGSRNGTYVNQQRIVNHRLRDGDQITFGPVTQVPITAVFYSLPASQKGVVLFDDQFDAENINLTIDVAHYERLLFSGGPGPTSNTSLPGGSRTQVPIIALFKQVGEILLASRDLDEMLGKVVELALASLPAQRGFICLCDPATETITPRTTRIKGLASGESIAISRSIARTAIHAKQALLVQNTQHDVRFAQVESIRNTGIRAAMCAPLYHDEQVQGLIYVDTCRAEDVPGARDLELLTALGALTAVGIEQVRLRDDVARERAVRDRLARYSSPAVVEQIVARMATADGEMLSEQRQVSVLFGDLSGFTSLAEGMEPAEVARLLNSVFERLTHAVFLYDGTLDKYMGDAVMAVFGAPLPQADHAERAVRAGIHMQRLLHELNRLRPAEPPLQMRIGINSGVCVAGDIGSPLRKDYTVIGDVVNVASRLEASVAEAGQVVVGPNTYDLIKGSFCCRPLPPLHLKGKQQLICPYLVVEAGVDSAPCHDETSGRGRDATAADTK